MLSNALFKGGITSSDFPAVGREVTCPTLSNLTRQADPVRTTPARLTHVGLAVIGRHRLADGSAGQASGSGNSSDKIQLHPYPVILSM
ncbi:MAG: hypothetical protein IIB82_15085 [Bacteroidetes bacterium]|nr:hypothetical protein [Bacteroidota bacterium]